MKNSIIGLGILALLAGCGGPEDTDSTTEAVNSTTAAAPEEAAETPAEESADQSAASPASQAPARTTVSGTVDSLALDVSPPIVMMTDDGGTQYVANVAPSAADSVMDTIMGVGSQASLDCKPATKPEGAEPGYSWLDDCKLAN